MDETELMREAMRVAGSRRTERKAATSRENGAKNVFTPEKRKHLADAQRARRERERAAGLIGPAPEPSQTKRSRGRPRKAAEHDGK